MVADYSFYITPEEYAQAAENGISPQVVDVRVRSLAWNKSRAISEKPQHKRRLPEKWIRLAAGNGICYRTFLYRVNVLGWNYERAATQPLQDRKKQATAARESGRVYPIEIIDLAKGNGINYDTFRQRIRSGWNMKDAATRPTMTPREIGLMTKDKRLRF